MNRVESVAATILEFVGKEEGGVILANLIAVPITNTVIPSKDKSQPERREKVVAVLTRCKAALINRWLVRTKETPQLNHLHLSDDERTGHLPKLIDDMIARLSRPKLPGKTVTLSRPLPPSNMASCDRNRAIRRPC